MVLWLSNLSGMRITQRTYEAQVAGHHPWSFWLSGLGLGPEDLHFYKSQMLLMLLICGALKYCEK